MWYDRLTRGSLGTVLTSGTLGEHDYTHLGSLEVQPNIQAELIAKGAFLQNFFVNTPM
jgi:hypothetical protein